MLDEDDVPVAVYGGAAGTQVVTEDLTRVAGLIEAASTTVEQCSAQLRTLSDLAYDAGHNAVPEVQPGLYGAAERLDWCVTERDGTLQTQDELASIGADLRAACQVYLDAEAAAREHMTVLEWFCQGAADVGKIVAAGARGVATGLWKASPPGLVATAAGKDVIGDLLMPDAMPPLSSAINSGTTRGIALDVKGRLAWDAMLAGARVVLNGLEDLGGEAETTGARTVGEPVEADPPRNLRDIMIDLHHASVDSESAMQVTRVDGPLGPAFIVLLPGTVDHSMSDDDSRDWESNITLSAGEVSGYGRLIIDAMRQSIGESDAPILIAAHSQGGLAAMVVADDDEVRETFNLTDITTAGSPVGDQVHRDEVHHVHIMALEDPVPGASPSLPPGSANVVNVVATLRASTDPEVARSAENPIGAHSLNNYAEAAEALMNNDSASGQAALARLEPFVTGTSMTVQRYAGVTDRKARNLSAIERGDGSKTPRHDTPRKRQVP